MMMKFCLLILAVVARGNGHYYHDYDSSESSWDGPSEGLSLRYSDASNKFASPILSDQKFMDSVTRLNRERVLERIVHARGTGAHGYFENTNNNMSRICKADLFNGIGKRTPISVRFATGAGDTGSSDSLRDTRGCSIKFRTKEGIFDLIGFHIPVFFSKHPSGTHAIVHAVKRKPDSNLYDMNTYWDAITLMPDSLHFFIRLHSDKGGIPATWTTMPGYPLHTYQVVNHLGESHFVRFHLKPDAGAKSLTAKEAADHTAADPDFMVRDLYNKIENGEFPSWTVSVQILTIEDMRKNGPRYADITRIIPTDEFPLHEIGRFVLNKNADHFQNEIEKMAICPCNVVPGILGGVDKVYEARTFIYRDAQRFRVGTNCNKLPVNRPIHPISTYNRDGMPPLGNNDGNTCNYYPNSFGGPQPYDKDRYKNKKCASSNELFKITENPDADNFEQIADYYNELNSEEKTGLINNLATAFATVQRFIQERFATQCMSIHPDLGNRFARAMNITLPKCGH